MKERTILFVDDEVNVLNSLRRGLIDENFKSVFANSGAEALKILENQEVHVIVSDMKMPGMNGLELLKITKEKYPDIVRIVLSGYTQLSQVLATINNADIFKFITKPWKLEEEFVEVLHQAIDYYNLVSEKRELSDALEKRNRLYQGILKNTEEKISYEKTNYENIRKISKDTFNILKLLMQDMKEKDTLTRVAINEFFAKIEKWYIDYLDVANAPNREFDMTNIQEDLEKKIKDKKQITKKEIKTDKKSAVKLMGNYKLLIYILDTVINFLIRQKNEYSLSINMIQHEEIDGVQRLYFLIEITHNNEKNKKAENDDEIKMFILFINDICTILNGGIALESENAKGIAKIKLDYKKTNGGAI